MPKNTRTMLNTTRCVNQIGHALNARLVNR